MNEKQFFTQLLGVALLTALLNMGLLWTNDVFRKYEDLAWFSLGFFYVFNILMYVLAKILVRSSNKFAFSHLIMSSMMLKMMLSVVIVMQYRKMMQPDTHLFVLPFFLIYFISTIFETYFMVKVAKTPDKNLK